MQTVKELLAQLKKKISFTYGVEDYEEYDYTPEEHKAIISLLSLQVHGIISQAEAEREIMIQAFYEVRKIFECRDWIMEGRGIYPYNDDRYKEEVRYLYDEFDALQKKVWANIKSYTYEYRKKIIDEYKAEQLSEQPTVIQSDQELWDEYCFGYDGAMVMSETQFLQACKRLRQQLSSQEQITYNHNK